MEKKQQRLNSIIVGIQVLIFVVMCVFCIFLKGNKEYFFVAGALIAVSFMMVGIFRYILKTKSYDLLSGVNTQKNQYDLLMLRKIILDVEFIFVVSGIIISSVIMCLGLIQGSLLSLKEDDFILFICVMVYVVGILIGIYSISKRIKLSSIL